jgi:hypothetical protein
MRLSQLALFVSAASLVSSPVLAKGVTEADLRGHIEILASDEFEGRKPGTEGEAKTVQYIAKAWANCRDGRQLV